MPISARRRALPNSTCSRPDMGASASPTIGKRQVSEGESADGFASGFLRSDVLARSPSRAALVTTSVASAAHRARLEPERERVAGARGNHDAPRRGFVLQELEPFLDSLTRFLFQRRGDRDGVLERVLKRHRVRAALPERHEHARGRVGRGGRAPNARDAPPPRPGPALVAETSATRGTSSADGVNATVIFPSRTARASTRASSGPRWRRRLMYRRTPPPARRARPGFRSRSFTDAGAPRARGGGGRLLDGRSSPPRRGTKTRPGRRA